MTEHQCIDCKAEDPGPIPMRPIRKIPDDVIRRGPPLRCHTHQRAHVQRSKKQARARQVERTYDITETDNYALYLLQGGRCWLCQKATGAVKSLAIDHDHATNEVRGRLCGPCNQFIGRLGDSPEAAQRLVAYLTGDTPYRRLKAQQAISQHQQRPGTASVVVHRVYRSMAAPELWAEWSSTAQPNVRWHTCVRGPDMTWRVHSSTVQVGTVS